MARHIVPALFALMMAASAPLGGLDASGLASPATVPLQSESESKARQIIERAIQAHGGREAWRGKRDAAFSTIWTHYAGGQARFASRYLIKFPIEQGPLRTVVEGDENGKPVLMGVSGSRSWFQVGAQRYEDVDSLKANRAFVRRAYSLVALPFRLDDPSYRFSYDGSEVRAGAVLDRVRVEHGLEPAGLCLFDRETGRMVGMGSVVADPPTATVSEYLDYTLVDGILVPQVQVFDRVDSLTGGRTRALTVNVEKVHFDNGFASATFEPPPLP